jgi:uncharacterized membrane protein YesL
VQDVTNQRRSPARTTTEAQQPRSADLLRSAFRRAVWNTYDHLGLLVLANLIWLLLCIPVITAPAATAGLFRLASTIDHGEEASLHQLFVGVRTHFVAALKVGLFDLASLLLLWINIDFYSHLRGPATVPGMVLAAAMIWLALFLMLMHAHLYPLLADGEKSLKQLLRKSALLTLDNPAFTIGITLQAVSLGVLCVITGAGLFLVSGSLTASLLEAGHRELMAKYRSGEDPPGPETRTWRDLWRPWESGGRRS